MSTISSTGLNDVSRLTRGVHYKTQGGHPGFAALLWATGADYPIFVPVQRVEDPVSNAHALRFERWLADIPPSNRDDIRSLTFDPCEFPSSQQYPGQIMTVAFIDQAKKASYAANNAVATMLGNNWGAWHGNVLVMGTNKDRTVFRDLTPDSIPDDIGIAQYCAMRVIKNYLRVSAQDKGDGLATMVDVREIHGVEHGPETV